jgi:hypothetical protein
MYGGHWAGETTHALSALYSATFEFDTVSHDMAQCASLVAPLCARSTRTWGIRHDR